MWIHCGVSGVNGNENGSVEGIAFAGTDDEEQDAREKRTRVDEDISIVCSGLDSRVCNDIVLDFLNIRMACEREEGGKDLRTVPLVFHCALDLQLALDRSTFTLGP